MSSPFMFDASQHPIKAVTVFSSKKAEVIRAFTVDLKKGQSEIKITNLPSCVDLDTARLSGLGDAVLFDVVCRIADDLPPPDDKSDKLRALERAKATLLGEKRVREHEADILVHFGKSLTGEKNTTDELSSFLSNFIDHGRKNLKAVSDLDAEILELKKEMEEEARRVAKANKRAPTGCEVTAVVMAQRDGKLEINLTYMVRNAEWSPSYDLRATTENGKPSRTVSLHYRASISQNTGEDWKDTALTLSTAQPDWSLKVPELNLLKITPPAFGISPRKGPFQTQTNQLSFGANNTGFGAFGQQAQQQQHQQLPMQSSQQGLFGGGGFGAASTLPPGAVLAHTAGGGLFGATLAPTTSSGLFGAAPAATVPLAPEVAAVEPSPWPPTESAAAEETVEGPGALSESGTVVTEGAVASSYRIEGSCSIPSEADSHKVAIAILPFEAKTHYVAVPRIQPVAFLQCEVTNSSEYRLLPGPVMVYMDNSPVSKTSISDVNPEETFQCTLGPDPSIRVSYTRYPRTVDSTKTAFAAHTTNYNFKTLTVVQNKHSFPIKNFVLRDVVPLSVQQNIQVVLKAPKGLADATDDNKLVEVENPNGKVKVGWTKSADGKSGDKEGKYEWLVDIGAGDEMKLDSEWEVRAPAEFTWSLQYSR